MPQPRRTSALVVGGGFVGMSAALRLRQATGGKITMLEAAQGGPGTLAAASFGNAGTFAQYANVPVARPGLWREAARMLVAPGSFKTPPPLSMLANGHAPALVPWLARLVRNCAPNRVRATALALGALLARAERAYDAVFEAARVDVDADMGEFASDGGAGLPFALRNGYLLLHNSAKSLEGSSRAASLRREGLGPELRMERVDASGVLDLEPGIAPSFVGEGGAWYFPDAWCLREPAALLRALAHGFLNAGGEVRSNAPVEAVGTHKDGRGWVRLKGGESISADVIVVAAGAHSAALAATTGDAIPLDTERGHSVTFAPGSEHAISRAVCTADGGFILTPMVGGLRAAGLVELGGLRAPLTRARCEQLESVSRMMLRDDIGDRVESRDWLGFRPTLPDALPVIGRSPSSPAVVYAFGHQHVGWTLGGITADLVASIVRDTPPVVPLDAFRPDRFRLW